MRPTQDAGAVDTPSASAPTYSELYATYFAPGTPGHCATAGCHADPHHNVWQCNDEESCFLGMVDVGLIDLANPVQSDILDEHRSPLTWINTKGGDMPLDAQGPNEAARAALVAWILAGAPRD